MGEFLIHFINLMLPIINLSCSNLNHCTHQCSDEVYFSVDSAWWIFFRQILGYWFIEHTFGTIFILTKKRKSMVGLKFDISLWLTFFLNFHFVRNSVSSFHQNYSWFICISIIKNRVDGRWQWQSFDYVIFSFQ